MEKHLSTGHCSIIGEADLETMIPIITGTGIFRQGSQTTAIVSFSS